MRQWAGQRFARLGRDALLHCIEFILSRVRLQRFGQTVEGPGALRDGHLGSGGIGCCGQGLWQVAGKSRLLLGIHRGILGAGLGQHRRQLVLHRRSGFALRPQIAGIGSGIQRLGPVMQGLGQRIQPLAFVVTHGALDAILEVFAQLLLQLTVDAFIDFRHHVICDVRADLSDERLLEQRVGAGQGFFKRNPAGFFHHLGGIIRAAVSNTLIGMREEIFDRGLRVGNDGVRIRGRYVTGDQIGDGQGDLGLGRLLRGSGRLMLSSLLFVLFMLGDGFEEVLLLGADHRGGQGDPRCQGQRQAPVQDE